MAGPKIELNAATVRTLLKSDGVKADLERRAKAIAAAAGDGFEVATRDGKNRIHVEVQTATPEAMLAEAQDKRLTRAIDAGRQ